MLPPQLQSYQPARVLILVENRINLNVIVHNKSGSGGIGYKNPKVDKESIIASPDPSMFEIKEGDFDKKPLKVTSITEKLYYKK